MKPRLPGGIRVREPRIDPQPPPHERDDERLTRPTEDAEPVDLPDGDDDSEEEPTDNQPDMGGRRLRRFAPRDGQLLPVHPDDKSEEGILNIPFHHRRMQMSATKIGAL